MKVTTEQLKIWEDTATNACQGYPAMQSVWEDVEALSGPDDLHICLLTIEELAGFGTVCGNIPNACFTPEVIDFLKERNVKFAIVGLEPDHDDNYNPNGEYLISGGVLPLDYGDGDEVNLLSDLISENGGSWRPDGCINGWSGYESE